MIYLQDSRGNVVRALDTTSSSLIFVVRHDTGRIEYCDTTEYYEKCKIPFTVLDTVNLNTFKKGSTYVLPKAAGGLSLVNSGDNFLKNIELPKDDPKRFNVILKKTSLSGVGAAVLLVILGLLIKPTDALKTEEPQIVQVMDRQQMEKFVVEASEKRIVTPRTVVKNQPSPKAPKKNTIARQSGVLGVLGSLSSSKQKGGLKLSQAETSAGIGRGGNAGSGGVQTAIYSKGLFSAPLGTGGKANGGGGYGTKGKGGGQAGYGNVSLVGSGGSYFQAVESDAWVEGGLDKNEIAAVIRRHESEVRYCYEQGLQTKPALSGRLSMKFMIGPKGSVTLAQVMNSSLGHKPVENCIRDRLKSWAFPQPQGGVTVKVNYPFILRRVSDS